MSLREGFLRLLGLEAAQQGARLFSDDLYGIRPGVSMAAGGYGETGDGGHEHEGKPYRMVAEGIAEIRIVGVLSKRPDLWRFLGLGCTPTLPELAASVRAAAADGNVRGILLLVDSPGGTVAGTLEVAQAVADANASKPVHAYASDDCSSCAYWIASQARRLTSNAVAHVGCIGVYSVLVDAAGAAEMNGLRFIVVKSGEFKGAGVAEAGISDDQIAYFQGLTDDVTQPFLASVAAGRAGRLPDVAAVADGRSHVGQKAVAAGLSDGVETYAQAVAALVAAAGAMTAPEPVEPAETDRLPDDLETDPAELPDLTAPDAPQENGMSQDTKPVPTGQADEERSFVRRLMGLLKGEQEPSPEPKPAAALTAEQVQAMVAAGIKAGQADQAVALDLAKLEGKAAPAAINALKPAMVKAKAEGRDEDYAAMLTALGASDVGAMLGGAVASDKTAGSAHTGLGVSAHELALLEQMGMKREDIVRVEAKYLKN